MIPTKIFSGLADKIKRLIKFKTLQQFNNAFDQWMLDYKNKFTKGELQALKRLSYFAAKFPGVAFCKIGTLLKLNYEIKGDGGFSRSTFNRMLVKAKKFGILMIQHTFKKSECGRVKQGHSIYVFLNYQTTGTPTIEKLAQQVVNQQSLKTNNIKDIIIADFTEEDYKIRYHERQKQIRYDNSQKKFPNYNWLRADN